MLACEETLARGAASRSLNKSLPEAHVPIAAIRQNDASCPAERHTDQVKAIVLDDRMRHDLDDMRVPHTDQ